MSQWGQQGQQGGYQYPQQTGYPAGQNPQFQQQQQQQQQQNPQQFLGQNPQYGSGFGGGPGLTPQATGYPGQQQQQQIPLQAQPTGYQRPAFLSQQPTGFPGSNFGQQGPPPVPSLPSQFQGQGSNFLNVNPQQSGFQQQQRSTPQPMAPQMTGFVDPRLQMMSSSFMPANTSSPYSAGGLPQLQTQLGNGGMNLQQSFQAHNQEQRGTAAPKVPWALSKGEKKNYDSIFRAWDSRGTGFIDGQIALEVFGQSGLDQNDLMAIWTLADGDDRGKLNLAEFHVAMGLIYRRLNGNPIPAVLPEELQPPSARDLDSSVDFMRSLLKNDPRSASPSQDSRLKQRSFNSTAPGAGGRSDGTVYKHNDEEPAGGYYKPRNRHIDRADVRTSADNSPSGDLDEMKRTLAKTAKMLDQASAEDATRTKEDEELERELGDLKYRVKRVQEDLDYVARGPRSSGKDEEKRRLERELLKIMHERLPEVERRIEDRERRKEKEKRQWDNDRDRRNDSHGKFDSGRGEYSSSSSRRYEDEDRERSYSRGAGAYDRDDRDRSYGRDRERSRSRSRERPRSRAERPRTPPAVVRSPPPAPPAAAQEKFLSTPATAPRPGASPAPSTKGMSPTERQAFIRAEAQRRMQARMQALGVSAPGGGSPTVDTSVEERLEQERKEAADKAAAAEKQAEERDRLRKERLQGEKAAKSPVPPTAAALPPTAVVPPPAPKRAPAPPPPVRVKAKVVPPAPVKAATPAPAPAPPPPAPVEPEVDPEEEAIRKRQEALRQQREARAERLRLLEQEEEEARLAEEQYQQRIAQSKMRATPSPAPPAPAPVTTAPPPPPPPALATPVEIPVANKSNNPFGRLMGDGGAPTPPPSATSPATARPNPFFKPGNASPARTPSAPPPSKSPKPTYHTAPVDDDENWDTIEDKGDDSDSSDEDMGNRNTRQNIAAALFGGIMPPASPAPQTPISAVSPASLSNGGPPPPPPPPVTPAAPPAPRNNPFPSAPAATPAEGGGDVSALMRSIMGGAKLKKTTTVDKSGPGLSGRVLGDTAPPAHINIAPPSPPPSPPRALSPPPPMAKASESKSDNRQSVDWYAGLAADGGAAPAPVLPATAEESEDEDAGMPGGFGSHSEIPVIQVEETPDAMDDIDKSVEYRVRSLYAYEGQRAEDLSFGENLTLTAHPSKSGGDWWHGILVRDGKSGFFPQNYVERLQVVKAKAVYSYTGNNPDELPFAEGDVLSIIDRSEDEWWKTEAGGVVFIVPAAYLEILSGYSMLDVGERVAAMTDIVDSTPSTSRVVVPPSQQVVVHNDGAPDDHMDVNLDSSDGSMSDSGDEGDYANESKEEREAREHERQRVLEAAGIVVSQEVKPQRRPPPAAPVNPHHRLSSVSTSSASFKELPAIPELDHAARLDDAFDRYESFKRMQHEASASGINSSSSTNTNRLSIASSMEGIQSQTPASPVASTAPSLTSTTSSSRREQFRHLLGRKTPVEGERGSLTTATGRPVISGPIGIGRANSGAGEGGGSPTFGSNWASLVNKSVLEDIPANERKRQEIIFELINTESSYVRDLQLIVGVFYSSMLPMLDMKAVTVVFANVEDLLLTNTAFLSSLEERQKACRLYVDRVGDILAQHMSNMGAYMEYCVNQATAIKVLQSLRDSNPELSTHLVQLREEPTVRGLDLSSYLLAPMQRITRYPLLIRQILSHTDQSSDRDQIEKALDVAEKILEHINETIREQQGRERLKEISAELWVGQGLVGYMSLVDSMLMISSRRLDLTAPTRYMGSRKLLREGLLLKAKSGKRLRGFLCNDIFVLTDEGARSLYRMPIPLVEIQVMEAPGGRDDTTFQIGLAYPRGGDTIGLRATSVRDCQLWMQAMEGASKRSREAEKRGARKAQGSIG